MMKKDSHLRLAIRAASYGGYVTSNLETEGLVLGLHII